jgi:hypothetical protein
MNTNFRELNDAELDIVSGGMDPNYKECAYGTTAGGSPGVYPWYADCSSGSAVIDLIDAFLKGVEQGRGKGKGGSPK